MLRLHSVIYVKKKFCLYRIWSESEKEAISITEELTRRNIEFDREDEAICEYVRTRVEE